MISTKGAAAVATHSAREAPNDKVSQNDDNDLYDDDGYDDEHDYGQKKPGFDLHQNTMEMVKEMAQPPPKKKLRFIHKTWFKGPIYFCIVGNCTTMGLAADDDADDGGMYGQLEALFTAVFFIEMVCKLCVLRWKYFRDNFNKLDFFLVWFAIVDAWILAPSGMTGMGVLQMLRILRLARMIRLIREFRVLWLILGGLAGAGKAVAWVLMLAFAIVYIFAILLVVGIGRKRDTYPGYDKENVDEWNAETPGAFNNYQYFGTMGRAIYTLFCITIMAEYDMIGRAVFEYQPSMIIVFVLFIVVMTFGILNVFVGVIVEGTMKVFNALEKDHEAEERKDKLALLERIKDSVFQLDTDGNDVLTYDEVKEGMHLLAELLDEVKLPHSFGGEHGVQRIVDLLDTDCDGSLTSDEFVRGFFELIYNSPFQNHCVTLAKSNAIHRDCLKIRRTVEGVLKREFQRIDERLDDIVLAYRRLETVVTSQGTAIAAQGESLKQIYSGKRTSKNSHAINATGDSRYTTVNLDEEGDDNRPEAADSVLNSLPSIPKAQPLNLVEENVMLKQQQILIEQHSMLRGKLAEENAKLKGQLAEKDHLVEAVMGLLGQAVASYQGPMSQNQFQQLGSDPYEYVADGAGVGSGESFGTIESDFQSQSAGWYIPEHDGRSTFQNGSGRSHRPRSQQKRQQRGRQRDFDEISIASSRMESVIEEYTPAEEARRQQLVELVKVALNTSSSAKVAWQSREQVAEITGEAMPNPEDCSLEFLSLFLDAVMPGLLRFVKDDEAHDAPTSRAESFAMESGPAARRVDL